MKAERHSPLLLYAALASCLLFNAAPAFAQQEDIKGGVGELVNNTNSGRSSTRTQARRDREAALRAAREKAACERGARELEQRLAEERAARSRTEQQAAEEKNKREAAEAKAARLEEAEERRRRAAAESAAEDKASEAVVVRRSGTIRRSVARSPSGENVPATPKEDPVRPVSKIEAQADYGITDNYRIGMRIKVNISPEDLQGGGCAVMAYFHEASGEKLQRPSRRTSTSTQYTTPDGQVSVRQNIRRISVDSLRSQRSVSLFMPYSEFPSSQNENLKFNVHLKCEGKLVARSDYLDFSLNDKSQ